MEEAGQITREADERSFFAGVSAIPLTVPAQTPAFPETAERKRTTLPIPRIRSGIAVQVPAAAIGLLTEEQARGALFLMIPVFVSAGVLAYFTMPVEPGFRPVLLGSAAVAVALYLARGRPVLKLAIATLLLFLSGMLAGKIETWRMDTKMLGSPVTTRVTGAVRALEYLDGGRVRLTIDVISTRRPKLRYQPDRIRVSTGKIPETIRPGSVVSGLVRLFPARGPLAPNGYDFAFENYFDGIGANGFFLGAPRTAAIPARTGIFTTSSDAIENVRLDIYARITSVLPGETGDIAAALITGLKRGISEKTNDALRRTGLAHILSISGLHMALAAGTIMGALRLCFALFPGFASRHPVKKYSATTALVAGFAYLLLSGGGVATQRSFIMLAIMLVALLHDHAAITMRNLAIAAIFMIAVSPHDVAGPSFQMSFAATAALVAAYGAWTEYRFRRAAPDRHHVSPLAAILTFPLRYAGGLALTSLVAGTATAIFAAYHFHRIAPLGLPANLAALPVFSTLVMPPAIMAMVLMPFDLDAPALHVMGFGINLVTSIAGWFARHTAGDITGLVPVPAVAFMTVALIVLVIATTKWRLAAIPFIISGAIFISKRQLPDIMVSEDAGLVAVRSDGGALAVSRSRPNDFVIGDWEKTSVTDHWVAPEKTRLANNSLPHDRFQCEGGLCLISARENVPIAYVSEKSRIKEACEKGEVIIIADPTARQGCPGKAKTVLTAKDLALHGTAFIYLGGSEIAKAQAPPGTGLAAYGTDPPPAANTGNITVRQAIRSVDRPWHHDRIYLRHARGLRELN